jgi:cell division protease FtsH
MDNKPKKRPGEKRSTDSPLREKERTTESQQPPRRPTGLLLILLLMLFAFLLFGQPWGGPQEVSYKFFRQQLKAENIARAEIRGQTVIGEFKEPPPKPTPPGEEPPGEPVLMEKEFSVTLPPLVGNDLDVEMLDLVPDYDAEKPADYSTLLMGIWLVVLLLVFFGVWAMIRRTREQMLGGGMLSGIVKSPARRYESGKERITFDDVAGLGGVKRDLQEIVDYLKDPEKFQRLGARVPKGVLLMGPPGTGKTLLARAVAGEAGVPFFSINGSEFIQLFVGVGAGRVRDMFNTAKEAAPAILFIDEIDAVGRQRGAGLGGGHDEREQTLNQILSEMDGFSPTTSVIVLAATNRPDVLDPALLRPGRFDRHITVDRPTIDGRRELFAVHSKDMPLADDVDFDRLAKATVGLTGADIRNLVNEAALWATRNDKQVIDMSDFEIARDKILMGAKREEVLTEHEKRITAYHEAGHALLAWIIPGVDLVHKVTVIPRGRALGVTQLVPLEDRYNLSQTELEARLTMMLGGRGAEKLVLDELSAGAENDLKEATRLARKMVSHWGMSKRLGPVAFHIADDHPFLGREIVQEHREFSEHTARMIDEEVTKILHEAEDRAETFLSENRDKLSTLAEELLKREMLDSDEIEELIGPSINPDVNRPSLPARVHEPAALNTRQRTED